MPWDDEHSEPLRLCPACEQPVQFEPYVTESDVFDAYYCPNHGGSWTFS
jgi:hypothetical protein